MTSKSGYSKCSIDCHNYNDNISKPITLTDGKQGTWKQVYQFLEKNHHETIISAVKRAKFEESLVIEGLENCGSIIGALRLRSDLLRQIINTLEHLKSENTITINRNHSNENDVNELDKLKSSDSELQSLIEICQKLRATTRETLFKLPISPSYVIFIFFLVPFFIALFISLGAGVYIQHEINEINIGADIFVIFAGIGLIAGSFPIVNYIFSKLSSISGGMWRKKNTKYDDVIFKIFSVLIYSASILYVISIGSNILIQPNGFIIYIMKIGCLSPDFTDSIQIIFSSLLHLLLPFSESATKAQSVFSLFQHGTIFIFRIILVATIGYLIMTLVSFFIYQYNQHFFYKKSHDLHLPPELLNIFGIFTVFIISSFLTYLGILDYLYGLSGDVSAIHGRGSSNSPYLNKALSLADFIPYTIFIALIGFGLSLSTKNLLENYFSGISLKVDPPFEEGDRIKVEGSGMLEVREIGVRSSKFYDIKNNSIVNISHNELSRLTIDNYTHPTLDYRQNIKYSVTENTNERRPYSLLRECESNLLASAFLAQGVKYPTLSDINGKKHIPIEKLKDMPIDRLVFGTKEPNKQLIKSLFLDKIASIIPSEFERENSKHLSTFKKIIKTIRALLDELIIVDEAIKELSLISYSNSTLTNCVQNDDGDHAEPCKELCLLDGFLKYVDQIFSEKDEQEQKIDELKACLKKIRHSTMNVSYIYFRLAKLLWNLKDPEASVSVHRKIDAVAIDLLNVPRVESRQLSLDKSLSWEVSLDVTLELSEQSDEIIHHINLFYDAISRVK